MQAGATRREPKADTTGAGTRVGVSTEAGTVGGMIGAPATRGPRTRATWIGVLAAVPLAILALALLAREASLSEVVRFTGFCVLGIGLPGLVLWRLLGGYRRNLVEDCAAGFAVGTSVQVLVYLASSSIGWQRWSWAWAPAVLIAAVAHRGLRSTVWRRVEEPLRPTTAWLLSATCALVMLVVYRRGPGRFVPAYTDPLVNYPDLAFQQALAASAKYDQPIGTLWLDGEPMRYHTFFHQATAATTWATGIDLTSLIHSLTWLPLLLAGSALVFVLTQRFVGPSADGTSRAGATWAAPLAVLIAGLGGALQPLPEVGLGGISAAVAAYLSPTQNLGVMIALALCIVAVDLLRGQGTRGRWALLLVLALVGSGAKSTILPMAGCGFGLAFLFLLTTRRTLRTAVAGGAVMVLVFLGAFLTIYGGESWGTEIKPGATFAQLPPYQALRHGPGVDRAAQLLTAAATLLSWALAACGLLFLRRLWRDPGVVFLAGFSIAGFAGTMLTTQSGVSQLYFLRTAFPVIAVLACLGLVNLARSLGDRRAAVLVGAAGVLGLIACAVARAGSAHLAGVKGPWSWLAAALVCAAVLGTVGWKLAGRRGTTVTAFLVVLVTAAMVGAVTVPLQSLVSDHATNLVFVKPMAGGATRAEADAARWLKDNSRPGELVATNAHCMIKRPRFCDSRHFWIAALSERPVLVEGWSYSNEANKISIATGVHPAVLPYWDPEQLATNDEVFSNPSPAVVERLRRYGVQWLYADHRAGPVSPELEQFATLRHSTADATVYEFR
jgi:hypothetical protein